ncbi:TPA: HAD family hydrolase, partial [Clostridioides difficile]|nr:HAD family hydrolase [Clostridioides difficile]HDQ2400903.1 HAD family hydrolase [Clostridioides difficile]
EYLSENGAKLFDDIENTLKLLSKKYKLFIVSNCQAGYIESFLKAHKLEQYFVDFECPGNTGLHKGENNKLIIERNKLKNPIYIGDTQGDANSAKFAGIPFIYAKYGFGNVDVYDYFIDSFKDLLEHDILK